MILSSADILRILGGSEIVRLSARLKIVDGKPALSGAEGLFIYIDRFPKVDEFQATWSIYIESDGSEPDDLVLTEIKKLLPSVKIEPGLMMTVKTTDFLSANTQRAPEAPKQVQAQADLIRYEERFQALVEDVQDQMLLVTSGRPGRDGQDGRDGADGRDGRDLLATDAELFDLKDAGQSILPMEKGQVLTWDGGKWTNLFVRQAMSAGGSAVSTGGGTGGGTGVSSTIGWTYHPHDHTQEPNSGHFHADSPDGELVTVFHVSNETSRGNDVEVLLRDLLAQGYDRIYVALGEDLSQAHLYSITGYTETAGGFEINVAHVETAGLEPDYQNAKLYEFLFTRSAPAPGSVDNVTIVSETTPSTRDNGGALIQGDSWYLQSTDQLFLYIDGAWEEIKVNEGANGGVASGFWKFNDSESEGYDDGKFRVNSHQGKTDWSLTTELYVGYKTDDGANVKNILLNLIKPDQYVYVQRKDRSDAWVILLVEAVPVDADTKGCRITVSFISQGTAVADITRDKLCDISFMVVSGSGGGGGATTLADLSDTNTASAAEGDLLVYRSGIWTSETPAASVDSVNGQTGAVVLDADDIDDTSTAHKFATAAELTKLAGIAPGAEVNVNADWNAVSGDAQILNKPTLGTAAAADTTDFATAAQGLLADTALQPGDNISDLTNDAGYITVAEVPESGISEAPLDGNYYVRSSGAWVKLTDALSTLGVEFTDPVDGGNFTTGLGTAITNQIYDAGNFTDGTSAATNSNTIDGGLTTS